jgi:hypothetical protein
LESVEFGHIRLREREDYAEITIRLRTKSVAFWPSLKKDIKKSGLSLQTAFEEALCESLDRSSERTSEVQLARTAMAIYLETWGEFFRSIYTGRSHPITEAWKKRIFADQIAPLARLSPPKGRSKATPKHITTLRKKYDYWLPKCEFIHAAATKVAEQLNNKSARRKAIWNLVQKQIYGIPGDDLIMGGCAFSRIPGRRGATLEEPSTWTPHRLAIALLSVKVGAYQTVEKKLRQTKTSPVSPRL